MHTIAPTFNLMALVGGTSTNDEGTKLFTALAPAIATGQVVRISMHGATPMATSFLNSSFGELIDQYGLSAVRHSVKLVNYLPSHAARMKDYLESYSLPLAA